MQVVPVLDIKNSLVVRGVMGERANYRPIETPLSASPEPLDVAEGLMALHPFGTLYIADLDAIEGHGDAGRGRGEADTALIQSLLAAYPGTTIWLDAGVRTCVEAARIAAMSGLLAVVGSESVDGVESLRRLALTADFALSLDFRADAFLGPREILDDDSLWPETLIVMTLAKVGSGAGPDFERLAAVKARAGARRVFAAGGVRGPEDLRALADMGIAGALVATALHDGRISAADLASLGG
ncbi:nickel transporter [Jiella endophytica]|uniref:Nickel transporter n=1 Tax=Jiella endophytica TaxID=2558362 RepID=A0A4Y8RSV6_9HYPH|nr:HisA/HisF-related TIM barrel protein [Jiella endophytica]TFF27083.1 nickel transporter [Jiella endophytica]